MWKGLFAWFKLGSAPKPIPGLDEIDTRIVIPAADPPKILAKPGRFKECLKLILEFEGGLDDDPYDPGGRTAYGILQREYNPYRLEMGRPQQDVWKISPAEIEDIYRRKYWDKLRCDELPLGSDFAFADYGINSGHFQATKDAQRVVGVTVDGKLGPITIAAIKGFPAPDFITGLYQRREKLLRGLPTFWRFGSGWMSRCRQGYKFCMKPYEKV